MSETVFFRAASHQFYVSPNRHMEIRDKRSSFFNMTLKTIITSEFSLKGRNLFCIGFSKPWPSLPLQVHRCVTLVPNMKSDTSSHHYDLANFQSGGPVGVLRDTGYSRKKLPGYGIFEENRIGIQDIEKLFQGYRIFAKNCNISDF